MTSLFKKKIELYQKKELKALLLEKKMNLMKLRFKQSTETFPSTHEIKKLKKEIAVIKTLINAGNV